MCGENEVQHICGKNEVQYMCGDSCQINKADNVTYFTNMHEVVVYICMYIHMYAQLCICIHV